jgi:hypothetical protein
LPPTERIATDAETDDAVAGTADHTPHDVASLASAATG